MHNGEKQNSMPTPRGSAKCWTCAAHSWQFHLFILFTSHYIYCSLRFDQSIQLGALLSAPRKYFNWMIRIGLLGPLGARWDRISRRWTCGCSAAEALWIHTLPSGLNCTTPIWNQSMPTRRQSQFRFPQTTAWPTKAANLVATAKSTPNWASRATADPRAQRSVESAWKGKYKIFAYYLYLRFIRRKANTRIQHRFRPGSKKHSCDCECC